MRPVFEVPPPPANPTTVSTAGSLRTMSTNCCILALSAAKEMSCSACTDPPTRPVSCCGKKPLGTITYKYTLSTAVPSVTASVSGWCRSTHRRQRS